MKYLLLVSHASLAMGIEDALRMLLGEREFVLSCGMDEDTTPEAFRDSLELVLGAVTSSDEVILLSDLAGGSPLKNARAVLEQKGLANRTIVFGGANLPMAISAVMGIEDGLALDVIRDAMLDDGAAAVREL